MVDLLTLWRGQRPGNQPGTYLLSSWPPELFSCLASAHACWVVRPCCALDRQQVPPLSALCQEECPKSSFPGWQPHATASTSSFIAESWEAKVLEAKTRVWLKKGGWKTSSPIFPLSHLSCLAEILPNPLSSKGNIVFIYRWGQGQESHSWNAEAAMQEFSPWSQDKRWGGGGGDPHTTDGIFLLYSIKSCIRSDFSKEHFPTLFPFNFPLVTLQVICTGPVIQLSISWSIASLIVAPVYLFIFLKQPVLHP